MSSEPEKLAPGALAVVQEFVNTANLDRGEDRLERPEDLHEWLASHDLVERGAEVSDADLRRAIDVREGLRALLATHNGAEIDTDAHARLERAASRAPMHATFTPAGPQLTPSGKGADAGLASLLAIVATAQADGSWPRLKACADDGCLWAFFDHSKNRRGRWCSMAVCGNQHKARQYRERTKTSSG